MISCSAANAAEEWALVYTSKSVFPASSSGVPPRGVSLDPALADEQEPAHQVLEVDTFLGGGQQVAHADELELTQRLAALRLSAGRGAAGCCGAGCLGAGRLSGRRLAARRPRWLRRDPGYGDPPSDWRVDTGRRGASCSSRAPRFAARRQLAPAFWYIRRSMALNRMMGA